MKNSDIDEISCWLILIKKSLISIRFADVSDFMNSNLAKEEHDESDES